MDVVSLTVGLCNMACGIVFALVGMLLAVCRIPKGAWYGFRLSNAMVSDENWERVNRFGGQRLVVWAMPLMLAGVICVFLAFPSPDTWMAPVGLFPICIFVVIPISETVIYARSLPSKDDGKNAPEHTPATAASR